MQIEIQKLNKHYGAYHALKDINMAIPKGTFVALVGPSGCGKSTLLRTIAGLEGSSSGVLKIAGVDVNGRPPRERDVAMVFQSYALYPHMTVEGNMDYALRIRRFIKDEILTRTASAAQILGLGALMKRFPRQLSGGQRQRVAMGRAIVRNPKVFLFDEPLSNLDAALRVHMRKEIRQLHRRLGATSVYVTHDQIEAMTMADHIVVMRAGFLEQQGSPLELYDHPANKFVAGFIGSPAMNFLNGVASEDGLSVVLAPGEDTADALRLPMAQPLGPGQKVYVGLRPEHLSLVPLPESLTLTVNLVDIESTGSVAYLHAQYNGEPLVVTMSGRNAAQLGDSLHLYIATRHVHLFDQETEMTLTHQLAS